MFCSTQEELRVKIQEIYDENNQIFGAAKIAAVLKELGYRTSDKTVRKLMRDMGLIKNIYIYAIIDLYARMIIGYKVGLKNSTQLIKSTFKAAYELRHPKDGLIFHTDRGSNYRSKSFGSCVESLGVIQSFS